MDKEILTIILELTKESSIINISELFEKIPKRRFTPFIQEITDIGIILQPTLDGNYQISAEQRARLVIYAAKNGLDFETIIKHLTWQEFEILTTIVGDEFGYVSTTGLNFSTQERKYQIDVILRNKPYILFIDCKHFGGTGKQSILRTAALDQAMRVEEVAKSIHNLIPKLKIRKWKKAILIPMIITWLDDAVFFFDGIPVVPFNRLRSFFQNFYVYLEDIQKITLEFES